MSVEGSVRERRRAETVHEIKSAALEQLAEGGTGALSLRGVARAVGMTVQSLYHYFDSRDALLTELVVDAHHRLADAVQAAAEDTRGRPPLQRRLAATEAYRDWALANRSAFLLALRHAGAGVHAAARVRRPARRPPGWRRRSWRWCSTAGPPSNWPRSRCPAARGSSPTRVIPLPPGALAYFIELRGRMHGLVMLELLGHLYPFNAAAGELYAAAMHRMSADTDALQRS